MGTVWDRVRALEGATLSTLHRAKTFRVVAVEEDCVRVVPTAGNGTERPVRRDRIEHMAGLGVSRGEMRRRAAREFPGSRNTSYMAALAFAASRPGG